jgi:hypothetical protein
MEMFHRGGTKDDEEPDPERGSLEGDRFVGFFFTFFYVIGLEDHSVEKKGEETENEKQLDKEDGQVLCMVLNPTPRLQGDELIDVVEIDATGKQQDNEQDSRDFLVMLIERIGDRLDLFLRNRLLQTGGHGHDQEGNSPDPDDRRHQVKPMIDDWDQRIEVSAGASKGFHEEMVNG